MWISFGSATENWQFTQFCHLPHFIMQALGGFEPFSEDGYSREPSVSLYCEKNEGHFYFLKKNVNLSKGNYEIKKGYVTFIEKQKSGKAGIFHLGIKFEG